MPSPFRHKAEPKKSLGRRGFFKERGYKYERMNNQHPDFDDLNFGGFHANPEYFRDPAATYRPVSGKEVLSAVNFTESYRNRGGGQALELQREITQA